MRVGKRCIGGVSSLHPSWAMVVRLPGQIVRICSSRHFPAELAIVATVLLVSSRSAPLTWSVLKLTGARRAVVLLRRDGDAPGESLRERVRRAYRCGVWPPFVAGVAGVPGT